MIQVKQCCWVCVLLGALWALVVAGLLSPVVAQAQTYKSHPQSGVFKQNPSLSGGVSSSAVPSGAGTSSAGHQRRDARTGAVPSQSYGSRLSDARWGVGYSYPFVSATSLPSITLRMWQNQSFGVLGAFGLDTFENYSQLSVMGKIYYILLRESKMHFFANVAVGWLRGVRKLKAAASTEGDEASQAERKTSSHTFELGANLGVEYFLFGDLKGLQSALAVQFETGLSLISSSQALRFKTVALTPFQAGFTFYF